MQIFDLTKEITLQPSLQKKYNVARAVLHILFAIVVLFVAYRILFPIVPLDFAMDAPNALKNTLVLPRLSQTGEFPNKKTIEAGDNFLFNANPVGQFAEANFTLSLAKNSSNIEKSIIKIQKSYQAFFYPTGDPIGFKNGTLVSTSNGDYYIVSNGMLRKFSNTDIILKLGYPKSAFIEIASQDLKLNKPGEDITDSENYVNDSLFAIDGNYYQLKNQQLLQFVSARAFLSKFDSTLAIAKNTDFLSRYPLSETSLGFADGTLVSSADSVFILSEGNSYPIENEVTFSTMGFNWDNVIPVNNGELGAYKKQKQFTNDDPHPNGTIFLDQKTGKYFIIEDKKKREVGSDAVMKTYSKQNAISADSASAQKELSCILKKKTFSANMYACSTSLEGLNSLIGNDYQISSSFQKGITLNNINTTFSTPITFRSLMNSLSVIKTRLGNR